MGKKTEIKNKKKENKKPVKPAAKAVLAKKDVTKNVSTKKTSASKSTDSKKKPAAKSTPEKKPKAANAKDSENLKKKGKPAAKGGAKPLKNQKDFFVSDDDDEEEGGKEKAEETDYVEETEIEFIEENSTIEDLNLNDDDDDDDEFYGDDDF